MSIDYTRTPPTSITIRPEPEVVNSNFHRKAIQKATLGDDDATALVGKDGITSNDFVDMINPLQHIPIVSNIYRAVSGDEISAAPRLIGGALLGGVVGLVASAATLLFEQASGEPIEQTVANLFTDEDVSALPPEKKVAALAAPVSAVKELKSATQTIASLPALDFADAPLALPEANETTSAKKTTALKQNPDEAVKSFESHLAAPHTAPVAESKPIPIDRAEAVLELFNVNRTQAQESYAKTQGLMTSQKVARDLKL